VLLMLRQRQPAAGDRQRHACAGPGLASESPDHVEPSHVLAGYMSSFSGARDSNPAERSSRTLELTQCTSNSRLLYITGGFYQQPRRRGQ
jgi:hypothetical protein